MGPHIGHAVINTFTATIKLALNVIDGAGMDDGAG
jgi:hypothetical protein